MRICFKVKFSGQPLSCRRDLGFGIYSSNMFLEEFVLKGLSASPLMKPFLTPGGWYEEKCVY